VAVADFLKEITGPRMTGGLSVLEVRTTRKAGNFEV
jgi:hypothetical protein